MMSSFQGWQAEGGDCCTERLQRRIQSYGWVGVLSGLGLGNVRCFSGV